MIDALFQAYTPLLTWTGLGLLFSRLFPEKIPRLLGQSLYWAGIPLQLLVLARHTEASGAGWIPWVAIAILLASLVLALLLGWAWQGLTSLQHKWVPAGFKLPFQSTRWQLQGLSRATVGSFVLATILGNTGFVGLTLTDILASPSYRDWSVLFSLTSNVVGTYGLAVVIASYFGQPQAEVLSTPIADPVVLAEPAPPHRPPWWQPLRDLVTVPSLWAFAFGWYTRGVPLPEAMEVTLEQMVWVVIAAALLLVGLRLGKMNVRGHLTFSILGSALKVLIVPLLVGWAATLMGWVGDPRLVLVLMSGTPTGLSVLILAEVYNLDRDLLASSIAFSFVGMLLALPLWLLWFH